MDENGRPYDILKSSFHDNGNLHLKFHGNYSEPDLVIDSAHFNQFLTQDQILELEFDVETRQWQSISFKTPGLIEFSLETKDE